MFAVLAIMCFGLYSTASSEVLAEEFVGMMYDRVSGEDRYYSMLTGEFYNNYDEAIAATMAKLKEVKK